MWWSHVFLFDVFLCVKKIKLAKGPCTNRVSNFKFFQSCKQKNIVHPYPGSSLQTFNIWVPLTIPRALPFFYFILFIYLSICCFFVFFFESAISKNFVFKRNTSLFSTNIEIMKLNVICTTYSTMKVMKWKHV